MNATLLRCHDVVCVKREKRGVVRRLEVLVKMVAGRKREKRKIKMTTK